MRRTYFYRVDLQCFSPSKLIPRYQHNTSIFVSIKSYEPLSKAKKLAIEIYRKELDDFSEVEIEVTQLVGPMELHIQ